MGNTSAGGSGPADQFYIMPENKINYQKNLDESLTETKDHTNLVIISVTLLLSVFIVWFSMICTLHTHRRNEFEWVTGRTLAVIDVHTSCATIDRTDRLSMWMNHRLVENGTFSIRRVLSKECKLNPRDISPLPTIFAACTDETGGINGLACRVEYGYRRFLQDFPTARWYFKSMDDTWIIHSSLYRYLLDLEKYYDPMKHMVFISHANRERFNFYVHGGAGWLMSRAFVDYQLNHNLSLRALLQYSHYYQDDTAQSIIVRSVFPYVRNWDEMEINGFQCSKNDIEVLVKKNWNTLPRCPISVESTKLNNIIAQHMFGGEMEILALSISSAPDNIGFYRDSPNQTIKLCRLGLFGRRRVSKPGQRPWITATTLPEPLINWRTLECEP